MALDGDDWVSFDTAAQMLGISPWTVRFRAEQGDLLDTENGAGELGVTRTSVAEEQQWQATASFRRRARRGVRYTASWFQDFFF